MLAVSVAALLLLALRSLAGAATLDGVTVSPSILRLQPCETATLEITGHFDDGTTRDLSGEPGLVFAFETGNAAQNGPSSVVMNGTLDDALTVTFDGIDSVPVPILILSPQDLSLCVVGGTSTTTTQPPVTTTSSTTTTTSSTTTTSTTVLPTTTTPAPPTTTSTLPPPEDPEDAACSFCVHDRIQHRFRIENHVIFHREQLLQDRCAAVEFPRPTFEVAADGTQSSIFDVERVIEGSCQTTLTDPNPHFLDDNFDPIANPDPDFYGSVFATDRRPDSVRFDYTHPTTPPDDGDKFRVIRIGIFYIDRRNPAAGERLATVLEVRVYRPPVLMVHGLWSDAGAFADMEQTLAASNYEPSQLYRLDYRSTNDSSFTVNYPLVAGGIDAVLQQAADANLASGKVDVVTHSMGGVLSRLYVQNPGYGNEVRRIVTCNTPHAGSQMANLLLDRTFDPQGLVCSLLSQAMSSSTVPNRGCYNGAVDDMQVSSFATTNFLNLGVHPTDIEVHGLATVFDPNTIPDVSFAAAPFGVGPFLVARLLRGCGISLVDDVFNHDDSDLIVSATSQTGGLSGSLTSLYSDQAHMGSTANPDVIDRVKGLLNEPGGSSSFTRAGFSPGQLGYTTPSLSCPLLRRAQRLGANAVAPEIAITSPAQGTSVTGGSSLHVEVTGSPEIATVILLMSQPGSAMQLAEQPGPDAQFDVDVPPTAIGEQNVVVAGIDADGRLVAVSDTLTVEVTVPAALRNITIYPPVVYLQPCGTTSLVVTGHYQDGVDRDLSAQPGTRMTFAAGNAAQSGASGVVLNAVSGDAVIISFDGVDSPAVPIRALIPDDLGSCVVATTSTTTLPSTTSTTITAPSTTSTTTAPQASTTTTSTTLDSTTTTTPVTSTTSTPASSTTTSTLAPGCQADTECDDGDACTVDVCAPSGCNHVAAIGLDGAECLLSVALSGPLCPAGTISPKLEQFANAKLQRALDLMNQAELATKPKRQQRLLDKASKVLGKILRRKPGTTTDECLDILGAQIDGILGTLSGQPAEDLTFTIGGTVTGLEGTGLVLHEASNEDVTPGNGPFTFAVAVPDGSPYTVTVAVQPADPVQVCTVTNGSGTIAGADVADVAVSCVTPAPATGLDPGFGDAGKITNAALQEVEGVALQPDGKILIAGSAKGDFALARHNADGSLDTSFGSGGSVTTNLGGIDEGFDVALQPDGKIVMVGRSGGPTGFDFGVVRYDTDGSLDTGFGTGGMVRTDFAGGADYAHGVVIQADGKIVAAGHARLGTDNDFALARYDGNGRLDASFGSGGKVTTNVAGVTDLGNAVTLQADGKIVVVGAVDPGGTFDYHFGLARYATDGRLDTSFGQGGTIVGDLGSAYGVVVQPDGKIIAAGNGLNSGPLVTFDFVLARYDADGSRDATFGDDGRVTTDLSADQDFGEGVALQSDGKIVVVGQRTTSTVYDLAIARYDTDGSLDTSFGTGGSLSTDFNGSGDLGKDVAIQPDGKIVVGGYAANGLVTEAVLVRVDP
jgi:uncharacterized delta-60 repeat protein